MERSPSYPRRRLAAAVHDLRRLTADDDELSADAFAAMLGISSNSSGVHMRLASLRLFGLVDDRTIRLTPLGQRLRAQPRDLEALREAALHPKVFRTVWEASGEQLVDDEELSELFKRAGVTTRALPQAVDVYRQTLTLADFNPLVGATQAAIGRGPSRAAREPIRVPIRLRTGAWATFVMPPDTTAEVARDALLALGQHLSISYPEVDWPIALAGRASQSETPTPRALDRRDGSYPA